LDLNALLADPPKLHVDRSGKPTSWRVSDDLLHALDASLFDRARTLETGAGLSTILFAMRGCEHTAVVPDGAQAERIRAWCRGNGISTDRLEFILEPSEVALPTLAPDPLDVVLIDGAHGFPIPFLDWQYAGRRLKVGGALIIDDTQIWTGSVLRDFLAAESQWEIVSSARFEFAVARRVSEGPVGEWIDQQYVVRRSFVNASPSLVHKAVGISTDLGRNARAVMRLVRARDIPQLRAKIRSR
jgi:predicted O-methyltransferase YrrM